MASAAEIEAKVDKLQVNMDRLNSIINGNVGTTVTVDAGLVPSFLKLVADLSAQVIADTDALLATINGDFDALATTLATISPAKPYSTTVELDADLVPGDKTLAFVAANEQYYRKTGGTGTGSWTLVSTSTAASKALAASQIAVRAPSDYGSQGLRGWAGSVVSTAPVIVDAIGRALLWMSTVNGELYGRFDVAEEINRFMRQNFGTQAEGLRTYTGSGPNYPIVADAVGRMLIYYSTASGKVHIPELSQTSAVVGSSHVREPLAAGQLLPAPAANIRYGFHSYGQSLSIGAQGQSAISLTALYTSTTFTAGPKTTLTGNGFSGANQSAMNTSKPLVEDDLTPDGTSGRGETICFGAVNGAVELAILENGTDPSLLNFFASACGKGGEPIETLMKASANVGGNTQNYYQNFLDHVTKANALAVAEGKTYVVAGISWMQGEGNAGTTKASYKANLLTLIGTMQADVIAITGQTNPPHIFMYQMGSGLASGTNGPTLAMYEIAQERADCWISEPIYMLEPAADGTHIVNYAYHHVGRACARLLKSIIVDRQKPLQFRGKGAVLQGTAVRVHLDIPRGPVVLDTGTLGLVPGYGWKIISDAGVATITDVVADGGDVIITMSGTMPTTNAFARYGLDAGPVSHPSGKLFNNAGGGNMRDSTPDVYKKGGTLRSIPYWSPSFQVPIYTTES